MDSVSKSELIHHGVSRETVPGRRRVYRRGATRVCSGCGGPRDRGRHQAYCRNCHNDYERQTRPRHADLSDERRRRLNCRRYTNVLIARGQLERRPCACGSLDVEARQLGDYSDPRHVDFVCKICRTGVRQVAAA